MKEFEKSLNTGVQNFLNANIKDWVTEGGEGAWDRDVAHQVTFQPFVAADLLKVGICILPDLEFD